MHRASAQPLSWLIREYADLASTPEALLERLQSGRTLVQGLQRLDPAITPPIVDKMIIREALRQRRCPYIYTDEQVRCLLATALDMPSPRGVHFVRPTLKTNVFRSQSNIP